VILRAIALARLLGIAAAAGAQDSRAKRSSPIVPMSPTARTSSTPASCNSKSAASTRMQVRAGMPGTPFTARVGLFEWLEARISTDPGGIPVLSILPAVNVPTASAEKGLGSGIADYTLAILTGTDIGRHAHVDVNYGIGSIGAADTDPRFVQHLVSVSASDAISAFGGISIIVGDILGGHGVHARQRQAQKRAAAPRGDDAATTSACRAGRDRG
jgi:hypothetical protein